MSEVYPGQLYTAELARRGRLYIGWAITAVCAVPVMILGVAFATWLMWAAVTVYTVAVFGMLWMAVSVNFVRREP